MKIDYSRDALLTPFAKVTFANQYCLPGEGPQEALARAARAFSAGDEALAQRLYNYASLQWFAFATPLLANGGTKRGLPISCFLNYVDDSVAGLVENFKENAYLATNGGGIGTYWGAVRSVGETTSKGVDTPGVIPFMHVQDSQIRAYHQGSTRRGAGATYMDISHPEIREFIHMRLPKGDVHRSNEALHHGVCIPDSFMKAVANGCPWPLIDPHSGRVHETLSARALWAELLETRMKSGEPYLFFVDTANRALPESMRAKGLRISHTNLCTEIMLPTNKDRTAVCCLSSINLAKYDEIENPAQFIDDLVTMLDNCLDVFIETAPEEMWRAYSSAHSERSIGLGTLGFHTLLQKRGLAMSDPLAMELNLEIYQKIYNFAYEASARLARERGEPEDMKGSGLRNAHLIAIAPNSTTSIVCNASPSVEPMAANCFTQKTMGGSHEVRNPVLTELLESLGRNTPEVWKSIALNNGSVRHLDFLSSRQKLVFQTAEEVDNRVMIQLAALRQQYICQGQSVNLFVPPDIEKAELSKTHFLAWQKGLKSLYYLRSTSVVKTSAEECKACEA